MGWDAVSGDAADLIAAATDVVPLAALVRGRPAIIMTGMVMPIMTLMIVLSDRRGLPGQRRARLRMAEAAGQCEREQQNQTSGEY